MLRIARQVYVYSTRSTRKRLTNRSRTVKSDPSSISAPSTLAQCIRRQYATILKENSDPQINTKTANINSGFKNTDLRPRNKVGSAAEITKPDSEAFINLKKLKQLAEENPQMAFKSYLEINEKNTPILRPQMFVIMLPILAKYGSESDLDKAFNEIVDKHYILKIRPFHLMIRTYLQQNNIQKAMVVLDKMDLCKVMPDITIFGELFCALDITKNGELVAKLFAKMKQFDIQLDTPLFNLFLKRKKEAEDDVNNRMRANNSINSINNNSGPIRVSHTNTVSIQTALDLFGQMRAFNLQPDARTILHVLQLYGHSVENLPHIEKLIQVIFPELYQYIVSSAPYTQEDLQKLINQPGNELIDTYNINYLMSIYSKKKDLTKMERLFGYLRNYGKVSKVSFNALINFNLEQKNYARVVELAESMQEMGFSMSPYDAHIYVLALTNLGQLDKAMEYFEAYNKFNPQLVQKEFINEQFSDIAVLYAKAKKFDEANKWFDMARNKGRLTRDMYQKPIRAFAEAGNPRKALELLEELLKKHIRVENPVFDSIMQSYLKEMANGENLQNELVRLLDEMRNHEVPVSVTWMQQIKSILAQQRTAPTK